jgi:type I restriction enzyme M protein
LFDQQQDENFANLFEQTLLDISINNSDIFSVKTNDGQKIQLFEGIFLYINNFNSEKKNKFFRALINQTVDVNFEFIFEEKFDFFSQIFEYLLKDYNKDGEDVYAEYYTPASISKIISQILVGEGDSNVTVYDPSAGTGTLLMNMAHAIGEDKCIIYSQDIGEKSSTLLRLNLILNNLVHSINNVGQGNTMSDPIHKKDGELSKFDYIVSNPPFKLDFSDWRDELISKENQKRFYLGVPNIPKKKKKGMKIYLLFIQHILYSLNTYGKAAIVVPTGFLTAKTGIEKAIKNKFIEDNMLSKVISMPSNVFATTGTNVSILFLDKSNTNKEALFIDASNLGETRKEGKNQRTYLSKEDEELIINTSEEKIQTKDFSVLVNYDEILQKGLNFSAGAYFKIDIEYFDLTKQEFEDKKREFINTLDGLLAEEKELNRIIKNSITNLKND